MENNEREKQSKDKFKDKIFNIKLRNAQNVRPSLQGNQSFRQFQFHQDHWTRVCHPLSGKHGNRTRQQQRPEDIGEIPFEELRNHRWLGQYFPNDIDNGFYADNITIIVRQNKKKKQKEVQVVSNTEEFANSLNLKKIDVTFLQEGLKNDTDVVPVQKTTTAY